MGGLPKIFQLRQHRETRFTALVRPHLQLMYRMAYRWSQDRDEAEDLVQDVLTRLLPRCDELAAVEKPGPWLVKVLYRRYVDLYRRQQRSPIEYEPGWQVDESLYTNQLQARPGEIELLELQQALARGLASLSDEQRDAVLLHDVEGYSLLEVGEILAVNVGTVKSRLHRARKQLRNFLRDGTFDDVERVNRGAG